MIIRPDCMDCKKEIIDDLCLVMDPEREFETCLCLNCRDEAKRMLHKLPYIQKKTMNMLDANVRITPHLVADVISTDFARMLA